MALDSKSLFYTVMLKLIFLTRQIKKVVHGLHMVVLGVKKTTPTNPSPYLTKTKLSSIEVGATNKHIF